MKYLVLATHNKGKIAEFEELLAPLQVEIKPVSDYNAPVPAETGSSFAENALIKARAACAISGYPALADDSGICVTVLGGAPGIYAADWAETGQGRDFNMAMQKVHDKLGDTEDRSAWFEIALALVFPNEQEEVFTGTVQGHLIWPPRGDKGMGYDPMFVAEGMDKSFAEIQPEQKNAISHRARAVEQFMTYMRSMAA